MKNKTKIMCTFPGCGVTSFVDDGKNNSIKISSASYFFERRHRNNKELADLRAFYDEHPTMMGTDYFVNKAKESLVTKVNPDFPNNFIRAVQDAVNSKQYEYIFVSNNKATLEALDKAGIDYCLVYPDKKLKNEWIGRLYSNSKHESIVPLYSKQWDKFVSEMEELSKSREAYVLGPLEYVSDIVENLKYLQKNIDEEKDYEEKDI